MKEQSSIQTNWYVLMCQRSLTDYHMYRCWISETWKIYTFIVPILAVVGVNTIIGIRVVSIMCRAANTNLDGKEDSWKIHKVSLSTFKLSSMRLYSFP